MNRGQVHTLEAFVAALLLIAGLIFATQATAVTPLSASTSNQHIENQQRMIADDLLAVTDADGSLRDAILHWNNSSTGFIGSDENRTFYTNAHEVTNSTHPLNRSLDRAFGDGQLAYNIEIEYRTGINASERNTISMMEVGTPSDNAVIAKRTIFLFDSDETENGPLAEDDEFYAANIYAGELYNVLEVRITIWRM